MSGSTSVSAGPSEMGYGRPTRVGRWRAEERDWRPGTQSNPEESSFWDRNRWEGWMIHGWMIHRWMIHGYRDKEKPGGTSISFLHMNRQKPNVFIFTLGCVSPSLARQLHYKSVMKCDLLPGVKRTTQSPLSLHKGQKKSECRESNSARWQTNGTQLNLMDSFEGEQVFY